jgi:glutaredoxin-like protein
MTDRPLVTVYWRPGCGFCHILRRGLDRAGVERTEINIWEDPAAAAVVRSHARGNETVPTVLVGDVALVNPTAAEVLATRGRLEGTAAAAPPQTGPKPRTAQDESRRSLSQWRGMAWSVAACTVWAGLALRNPTTTYHLAPLVALLAWPIIARSRRARGDWRSGLLDAAGAAALLALTTLLLISRDALAGPALVGRDATVETIAISGVAALVALALASPRRRHGPARLESDAEPRDRSGVVTVVGSGGGCTTPSGEGGDQCGWTPGQVRD